MKTVGTVESLWRYPVKSMRGQQLESAFAGFSGIYGDRIYAIHDDGAPAGFPYLTGREREHMLLFQPQFRNADRAMKPENQSEAEALAPGVTPVYPSLDDLTVDVQTPDGNSIPIDDPALLHLLSEGLRERHHLRLMRSERALTDCRPLSLFSLQTVERLGDELGTSLDKRRFRANLYLNLGSSEGFTEDQFVGHTLSIGEKVMVAIVDRDPRCKMITLDPNTAEPNPEVMKRVAREHDGKAGIYAAVLVEGTIRPGDEVRLVN
ncbi:MOSC domain-containing protein [Edaphobacter aggregans]|uniref:MOSC domain-containing protein n=1 Tax=Edaphobacter aggregans TaxID=570835 RepID=UPI00054F2306|nr:MOSC domain-containing protein [Edaphobacter aggregans]